MKLVTFTRLNVPASAAVGAVLDDGQVLDLRHARRLAGEGETASFNSMLDLLEGGQAATDIARALVDRAAKLEQAVIPKDEVHLLAPLPRPLSIRDCMAFEQHVVQAAEAIIRLQSPLVATLSKLKRSLTGKALIRPPRAWYERPIYYKGNPLSVVGPEAGIKRPDACRMLDYELEIAAVIGKCGRDIPEGRAAEHVAGYMIFNDFSARDGQWEEMSARLGPAKCKDFDTGNAFGPWLVTPDEVVDVHHLAMEARINGQVWSHGHSSSAHWRFEQLISFISRNETLHPGEVIGSGTVGNGCGLELGRWLSDGDQVELTVDRLGMLRNRITASNSS